MVSANTETHQILEARDAGATEYLAKPVSGKLIYDRIVAVIENKRQSVRAEAFFGPDRRRLDRPYFEEERRAENRAYDAKKPAPKLRNQTRPPTRRSLKQTIRATSRLHNMGNEVSL